MLFKNKIYRAAVYATGAVCALTLLYTVFRSWHIYSAHSLKSFIAAHTNLVPFRSVAYYIGTLHDHSINTEYAAANLLKMFVVGVPAGFLLPQIFSRLKNFAQLLLWELIVIAGAQTVMLLLKAGSLDIDDFILCAVGTAVGFGIMKLIEKMSRKRVGIIE